MTIASNSSSPSRPALPRVTAILAVHNEADVIRASVLDLVEQGVAVYLLDHASTDGTVDAIADLVDRGAVRVERYPEDSGTEAGTDEFRLRRIIERKEQVVRELGPGWYINHDADEFRESPWTGVGLREGIARVEALGFNAIDFEVLDFLPTHDRFQPGEDPRKAFPFYRPSSSVNRVQIRCFRFDGGPLDMASSAGHEAVFPNRRVFPVRFLLRHYPYRGQRHGERKVFRERRPRYSADEIAQGWHVQHAAVVPGHRFIVPVEELESFDAESVRTRLWFRTRAVEEAEEARDAASASAEAARAESARLRRSLSDALANVERLHAEAATLHERAQQASEEHAGAVAALREQLRRASEEHAGAVAALREQLRRASEEHAGVVAALREQLRRASEEHAGVVAALREQLQQVGEERAGAVAGLEGRLAEVYASWSWRVTRPLRAVFSILLAIRRGVRRG